ncbi:MAG TPA: hypothetical protein VGD58_25330 [Herpetosiphonaceae bacterium]
MATNHSQRGMRQARRAGREQQTHTSGATVIADQIDTVDVDAGATNPGVPLYITIIVIGAFAIVLVGSFVTLAISMFVTPSDSANVQIILTMFTTVVGFLGGLFTPVPRNRNRKI